MQVKVLPMVVREIENEPSTLKENIYGVLQRLECGGTIPMQLCRPIFSIGRGLFELRFSCRSGEYRVFYYVKTRDAIYVIHAMQKKRQKMDRRTIDLLKARIRSVL